MSPPWLTTIIRTMASPSPVPGMDRPVALEARKNRVNSSFWSLAGMPMPVSLTRITADLPSANAETSTHPPFGVNLTELDSRLITTRSSWLASPSQQLAVGGADREGQLAPDHRRPDRVGAGPDHVGQVHRAHHRGERAGLQLGEGEHVVHQVAQPHGAAVDGFQHLALLRGDLARIPVPEHLHVPLDGGQRGTQLMGHRGEEAR